MLNNLIQIKIGASLASGFSSSFKGADKKISELTSSVRDLRDTSRKADAFKAMSRKVKDSNLVLGFHQKQLKNIESQIKKKGKASKSELKQIDVLKLKVSQTTSAYAAQTEKLEMLSSRLRKAGVDTNALSSSQERLASKLEVNNKKLSSLRDKKNHKINKQIQNQQQRAERYSALGSIATGVVATGAALVNPILFEREMSRTSMLASNNLTADEKKKYRPSDLKNSMLDIGKNYTFSSRAAARTAGDYAQSGFTPDEIKGVLGATFDIATISRKDPEAVAGLMRSLKSSFKFEASNKDDMNYLADTILKTANTSDADVGSLIETSKYLGGMPKEAGLSLAETFGMISTMSPVLKGSEAGTSTVQLLEKLSRKNTRNKLKNDMGIDVMRDGKMRHVFDILEDVKTRTKGLDKGKKLNLLTEIFDTQASRAIIPLISNMDKLKKNTQGLTKEFFKLNKEQSGKDYTKSLKEIADNNSYGAIMRVVSALDIVSVRAYSLFQEQLKGAADVIASTINRVGEWVAKNKELTLYIVKLTACVTGATLAFKVLRLAMSFSKITPFGLALTGVTLLVAGLEIAYRKFDGFKKIVDSTYASIKTFFDGVVGHKYTKLFLGYTGKASNFVGDMLSFDQKKEPIKNASIKKSTSLTDSRVFNVNMTVNSSEGQSTQELSSSIKDTLEEYFTEKNQSSLYDNPSFGGVY